MAEFRSLDVGESPSLLVRLYADRHLVRTETCDDELDAASLIEAWEQQPGRLGVVSALGDDHLDPSSLEIVTDRDLDDAAPDLAMDDWSAPS